jgi:hypothetical protein
LKDAREFHLRTARGLAKQLRSYMELYSDVNRVEDGLYIFQENLTAYRYYFMKHLDIIEQFGFNDDLDDELSQHATDDIELSCFQRDAEKWIEEIEAECY